MKIAIAGTNGLSQLIAFYLKQCTSHSFVLLSTAKGPDNRFKREGWQVLHLDYLSPQVSAVLSFTLQGIDLIISTAHTSTQLQLIDAAAAAGVKHFIPSSFSGPFQCSALQQPDVLWNQTLEKLQIYKQTRSMRYTIITCGVFFERFGPGGLEAQSISSEGSQHQSISGEGAYLFNFRLGTANIPQTIDPSRPVYVCLTSARDAAKYLVAALHSEQDLSHWPEELIYSTERMSVLDLVNVCASVRGTSITPNYYSAQDMLPALQQAMAVEDAAASLTIGQLIATAEGAFDRLPSKENITSRALVEACTNEPVEPFAAWLLSVWNQAEQSQSSRATSRS